MQYFENVRGNLRVHVNGHFYCLNKRSHNNLHWSCVLRWSLKCRAAVKTDPALPFDVKLLHIEHNHGRGMYKNLNKLRKVTDKQKIFDLAN